MMDDDAVLPINEGERAFFVEMRMLTTDAHGRETLTGLTRAEALEYLHLVNSRWSATRRDLDEGQGERYIELHDRHEMARLDVLNAEIEARNSMQARH